MISPLISPLHLFLALFACGTALRLFGLVDKRHAERLGAFVFSITLPATILVSLDQVILSSTTWKLPLAAWLVTVPLTSLAWLLARWLGLERPAQGGFALTVGSINSIYFAFPVMLATFGEEGLARAVLFDLGQTTLTLTVLYPMALRHGTGSGSSLQTLRRLVASPPLWALAAIVSMKVSGLHLPDELRSILTPIHWLTIPLASLVLGLSISTHALRRTWLLTSLGVALRMGGGLMIGWTVTGFLGLTGLDRAAVVLIAAMPSAVMAVIYASEAKLDEDLVASMVALSICLGVALLPWLPRLAGELVDSA